MSNKKPGGQPGNTGGLRHGCYVVGLLPNKLRNTERAVGKLRLALENAVLEARGRLTITEAGHINSACRWERLSQLTNNWLRKRHDEMSDADRLSYARESARASSERDRHIAKLKLDLTADDQFAALYGGLTLDAVVEATEAQQEVVQLDANPVETVAEGQ